MKKIKQKTHSGAKKRFKVTGTDKLRRRSAFGSHLLEKKDKEQKRRYRKDLKVASGDKKNVKKMLGM
ncbi:MAG: 50S ribosomal protein L35 [Patescibacteria group bacterium]|nr:50S ribosomal protein L35 [Patescibacteria group bacterium]